MDGRSCLFPVHDKANLNVSSKASTEYSPSSFESANPIMLPSLVSDLACVTSKSLELMCFLLK